MLEGIPREVAAAITAELTIPTIGIGAGPDCDGQILVFHDMLNLTFAPQAKFVRRYADAAGLFRGAVEHYREDVEHQAFPSDEESYHLPDRRAKRRLKPEDRKTPAQSTQHNPAQSLMEILTTPLRNCGSGRARRQYQ